MPVKIVDDLYSLTVFNGQNKCDVLQSALWCDYKLCRYVIYDLQNLKI